MSARPLVDGRAQVLLGDTTTHGGVVVSGRRNWRSFPKLLAVFFAGLCTNACQPFALANPQNPMITLHTSFWQIIESIQERPGLPLAHLEDTLHQTLFEHTEKSNAYFQFYAGEPVQLGDGIVLSKLDLRLPRQSNPNPALLVFTLQGTCIDLQQLQEKGPTAELKITGTPRGRSVQEATTHSAFTAWGQLDFGFQQAKPECVAYVTFKPKTGVTPSSKADKP